jgi:myotubularin-related protein 1/2
MSKIIENILVFYNQTFTEKKDLNSKKKSLKKAELVRERKSKDLKFMKPLKRRVTILPKEEDLEKVVKEFENINPNSPRSNSCDISAKIVKRYINKKQTEQFLQEHKQSILRDMNYRINTIRRKELELIKAFDAECNLYDKNTKLYMPGRCFVDQNYNFYFTPEMGKDPQNFNYYYYCFPLLSIAKCENNSTFYGPSNYCKDILLKDNRNFVLKLTPKSFDRFNEIIEKFSLPEKSISYFNYACYNRHMNLGAKNIKIYNIIQEFKRQNIDFSTSKQFRLFDNDNFKFCESYPKKFIVPFDMTDEEIQKVGEFRTKNRIPALTFRYQNGSCIWRSSQTRSGFKGVNKFDVLHLSKISNKQKLYIYDARPFINAYVNKFKGAGYENIDNYKDINIELIFCGMPNIHAVRNSYQKIMNTVAYNTNYDSSIMINIGSSGWYDSIIILLKRSFQICNSILSDCNVLIHCSDGWDRTSQLSSMAQILLDDYYRTLDGFICLIEKDWLSFGHQFRYRNGMYSVMDSPSNVTNENQFSPIFLQWLDALYQLMHQNYTKFEYNFYLLAFISQELFTGKYGTFLYNNDKEREMYDEENKTLSIWNYIKGNKEKFINHIYDPSDTNRLTINYKYIILWKDYFFKFENNNDDCYLKQYDKKLENIEKSNKKIIEKLSKLIKNKFSEEEIEGLDEEYKKILKNYTE